MGKKKLTEAEMLQRIEDLETKSAQAYQIIGDLLWRCGLHETAEGTRALDYFSQDEFDDNFLPWPRSEFPEIK